jgi:hypothetical protein
MSDESDESDIDWLLTDFDPFSHCENHGLKASQGLSSVLSVQICPNSAFRPNRLSLRGVSSVMTYWLNLKIWRVGHF